MEDITPESILKEVSSVVPVPKMDNEQDFTCNIMSNIYAAFIAGDRYHVWDIPVSAGTSTTVNITDVHSTAIASQIQRRRVRGSYLPDAAVSGTGV